MKRKFLEDMGLTKEQVDQIMSENGNDINAEKKVSEGYKSQLDEVQKKLKEFDGVDVTELQGKVTSLTTDLENQKTKYEGEIDGMRFNSMLESKVNSMNPRNAKAVMALLDIDTLKKSKNQDTDITAALESVKKENDYLFGDSTPAKRIVTGTRSNQQTQVSKTEAANAAYRTAMLGNAE